MRRLAPAIVLFVLSPFVAEFLLGDFPITMLWLVLVLGPMYGGGALLIRELTRRTGRGWPTMLLLALAFGVIEEGLVTRSLFNKDYVGAHLLDAGYVPALGIAVPWTLFVLTIHTVWSIATPIALIEEATGRRQEQPWLRLPGLVVTGIVFVLGATLVFAGSYADGHYLAPGPNLIASAVFAVVLIAAALLLPRRGSAASTTPPPRAGWLFLLAVAAGAVIMVGRVLPTWVGVATTIATEALVVMAISRWARRTGWSGWHRLALAAGALVTYAWTAFGRESLQGGTPTIDLVSHIVFALVALAVIGEVARRLRRPVQPAGAVAPVAVGAPGSQ